MLADTISPEAAAAPGQGQGPAVPQPVSPAQEGELQVR